MAMEDDGIILKSRSRYFEALRNGLNEYVQRKPLNQIVMSEDYASGSQRCGKGLLAAAAVAGACIAYKEVMDSQQDDDAADLDAQPAEQGVVDQEVVETITRQMVSEWFKTNRSDNCCMYLSYLTDRLSGIIGGCCGEELDKEHYLIQWVSDEEGSGGEC